MKRALLQFTARRLSFLSIFAITSLVVVSTGCGSSGSAAKPQLTGNTSVTMLVSSAANDQLSQFSVTFGSITLTSQSGKTVSLFTGTQTPEFIHVNGTAQPLVTVSVPQDVYTSAAATIQYSTFTCISLLPGELQTSEFGPNGTLSATLTLPSPITVTGTAMALSFDLQVSPSATFSNCQGGGATTNSITPTFTVSPVVLASQPTNVANGKQNGIEGLISSLSTTDNGISLVTADGITLSINTNASTVYQTVPGFSSLVAGMPVDLDATIQPDGSLLATRVAVEDTDPTNLGVLSGQVLFESASQPTLLFFGREGQGNFFASSPGPQNMTFGNAGFQISGQFTNLNSLPFLASFNSSNMFDGQNVYITSHVSSVPPAYFPATTITLMPQTINGAVSAVSSSGSFATYTVTLATYDLIPSLAVQPGQTTLLADPGTVVVYTDSNTQMLNTNPLAVGSVLRFNGLLFNDMSGGPGAGVLRMDCAQVNDGVPE